jgi:hypothetical protein
MALQPRRRVISSSRQEASQTACNSEVKPLTQEAAGDLHSVVRIPEHCEEGRGKNTDPIKNTAQPSFHGCHLLVVSFITSLKQTLCKVLTTQNNTENNCTISHA